MVRQHSHWRRLIGTTIQLRRHGELIRTGTVDDAMADSTVLWIAGDTDQPRSMYEAATGIEVWNHPKETETRLYHRLPSTARSHN